MLELKMVVNVLCQIKVVLILEEEEVQQQQGHNLIGVDIDIVGHRDDSNYVANLKFQLTNLLQQNFPFEF